MKKLFLPVFLFFLSLLRLSAQPFHLTTANVHSHNDYEQKIPFWQAYTEQLGSMEADIFLKEGELLVAHEEKELVFHRRLEELYLDNLRRCVKNNNGHIYADSGRVLNLLIDIKTDSIATLKKLVETLEKYPELVNNKTLRFVITGNRPDPSLFSSYPSFIYFDGVLSLSYDEAALKKIILFSDNFKTYSLWNGKGIVPAVEWQQLQTAVDKAHKLNKPVRFWNAPDFINAWYGLMKLGVDYLNTDHIPEIAGFLNHLGQDSYAGGTHHNAYTPSYKTDDIDRPVKNVVLLIGDGTGLAQLYAGYTANGASLSVFNMRQVGLSKTSSYDSYITDSAPGSTSFASGEKTNNRAVGADHLGKPLILLPQILQKKKIKTGLVTCGDIADATPADFYAHRSERDNTTGILTDLINAPVDVLMGSGNESLNSNNRLKESSRTLISDSILVALKKKYSIVPSIEEVTNDATKKWIVMEERAGLSMLHGRGNWLSAAFTKTLNLLKQNQPGFFIMTEAAQVDYGGHVNDLNYVVSEVNDFDKVIGQALAFADRDGETLVIVTADHETGGLSLVDGDYAKGYVSGQFSTNDHTALPVPVFAYGPHSGLFRGVYENTAIFSKILQAMAIEKK